jgi:hypothetical protein
MYKGEKKGYRKPEVEKIEIDRQISLAMLSNPGSAPTEPDGEESIVTFRTDTTQINELC